MSSTHNKTAKKILLELRDVSVHFGGIKAVSNLNLQLHEGEILALIGPNGAGKTTAFNVTTGVYQATTGAVFVNEKNTVKKQPHQVTAMGVARTFQNIRLFKELSIRENILIALDRTSSKSFLRALIKPTSFWREEAEKEIFVEKLLKIFELENISEDSTAKNLPYGVQRRLEIARAIATGAKILLLDEPAAGMNGQETAKLMETIRFIRDHFSLSILLIEHDMRLVMGISDRIVVLEYGKKTAEGMPKEIQENKAVIKAYLGTE